MKTFSKYLIIFLFALLSSQTLLMAEGVDQNVTDQSDPDNEIAQICLIFTERIQNLESLLPHLDGKKREECLREKEGLEKVVGHLKTAEEKSKKMTTAAWIISAVGGTIFLACLVAGIIVFSLALGFRRKIHRRYEEIRKLINENYRTQDEMADALEAACAIWDKEDTGKPDELGGDEFEGDLDYGGEIHKNT